MNRRYTRYPDDADYQTNAPSYYEDLARKDYLIKILAKRVWEYDKTLNMKLEEIEKVLEEMIDIIGEGFNEEIYDLLILWVEDGTLHHIINETLMNKKADITYVDDEIERLDQKDEDITTHVKNNTEEINKRKKMLVNKIVYTIGSGGDFETINEAIEHITTYTPTYSLNEDAEIELILKSGFIMREQVFIHGLDLSYITLSSEDSEVVIDRQF